MYDSLQDEQEREQLREAVNRAREEWVTARHRHRAGSVAEKRAWDQYREASSRYGDL